jgi:hypothetical protein
VFERYERAAARHHSATLSGVKVPQNVNPALATAPRGGGNIRTMAALHVSPYRGAGPDWPRCDHCGGAPVKVSVRRDDAYTSALFCAECAPRVRAGDESVVARVPTR